MGLMVYLENLGLMRELQVFLLAMIPVVELRGAIPWGAYLSMPWIETFVIAVGGNMLPVPFIILFIRHIFKRLKRIPLFRRFIEKLEHGALKKAGKIRSYSLWGLWLFIAIPLPGTGAWTGSLIAALLDLRLKSALPVVFAGVLAAGFVVSGVSYGFLGFLSFLVG